jgi:hypothetical protein
MMAKDKDIRLSGRTYDPEKTAWRLGFALKGGQLLLLDLSLEDLENLHATVREALIRNDLERMEAE